MAKFIFLALGNPGDQYAESRHNAGWLALDRLIHLWQDDAIPPKWQYEKKISADVLKLNYSGHEIMCVKPDTYMNESGRSAVAAVKWFFDIDPTQQPNQELRNLLVFHDDLDLITGEYKLKFASGPRVHNGYNSVTESLQTNKFWSARIGIDNRDGERSIPGKAYVLQRFSPEERKLLDHALQILAEELPYVVLQ